MLQQCSDGKEKRCKGQREHPQPPAQQRQASQEEAQATSPKGRQGSSQSPSTISQAMNAINILAISDKGKSRIGKKLTLAIIEQDHHDAMFIVIPGTNQCRWIKKDCDPDFRIIEND